MRRVTVVGRSWAAILLLAFLLAGCSGPAPRHEAQDPGQPAMGIAPSASLAALTPSIPVSVRGHRTSEFTVARDPLDPYHLVAAGMDWDGGTGVVQCAAFVSTDGGRKWTVVQALPGHASANEDTDPWVAIDGTGRVYLTCTEAGVGLLLGTSSDGGMTWTDAKPVSTGGLATKPSIAAFGDGEVYLCFNQGTFRVLHSVDAGLTWSEKSFAVQAGCNGITRSPDGTVSIVYQGGGAVEADRPSPPPPVLGVVSTKDNGTTWTDTVLAEDLGAAPATAPGLPQSAAPSIVYSPLTGTLFVAAQRYQNAEVVGPLTVAPRADGILMRSRDDGLTFEDLRLPVAHSEECPDCHVVHPTLTVDAKGRLVAQFTLSDSMSLRKEVYVSASSDEGENWLDPLRIAVTTAESSYISPGNIVNEIGAEPVEAIEEVMEHPEQAPAILTSQATHLTWPVTHRDGGEYFGITSTPDGIVDMWVQHLGDGQNTIMARIVAINE